MEPTDRPQTDHRSAEPGREASQPIPPNKTDPTASPRSVRVSSLTEQQRAEVVRAALVGNPLSLDEVLATVGHSSLGTVTHYLRRAPQATEDSPPRALHWPAATQARKAGRSFQEIADAVTGHRYTAAEEDTDAP